jgi:hypothetical protein
MGPAMRGLEKSVSLGEGPYGAELSMPHLGDAPVARRRRRDHSERNKTRRLLANRLATGLEGEESDSKGRLRVGNWIVPGLDDDAVKETVEFCFLVAL